MNNIKLLYIFFILAAIPLNSASDNPNDTFTKANELYAAGDYTEAVKLYKELAEQGYNSPELFYNIGNSYYRLRKIPETIYYFEKALRLNPDDADIIFNLNVANLRVIDKFEQLPTFFLTDIYYSLINSFNSDKWATLGIVSIWITLTMLILFLFIQNTFLKKSFFALAIFSIVFFFCTILFSYQRLEIETARDTAIIFDKTAYVKSSPEETGADLFILHEGSKVKITDSIGDWVEISLPNGNKGWLPSSSLRVI